MQHVVLGGERPKMDHSHVANWPIDLQWLIKSCWADSPDQRPSFETIKKSLEDIVNETTTSPVSPKRSNRSQTVGTKFSAASPDKFQHRAPLTPQPQSKSGGKAKIAPPVGGFGSIKKPDKSGGRSWSLGFRRGGSPKIV
uniref:Serine-threonine/tyrosine-protein kinase catalytic domain-containing protein n=1 Tax=Craspedostauros australis TaxID=1486917 RepID=A0A7S0F6S7_9STRA|mmetsp:Transcript_9421/g.25586  ORF Transcript_9421/g.25586 Transcript_9421/m.25586 type:complete len:140 (+) Transcript_9421:485-904(+)